IAVTVRGSRMQSERPAIGERIDVALRLRLIDCVLGLNLGHQIVLAFESGYLLGGELGPLLLDVAPHSGSELVEGHFASPKKSFLQSNLNDYHSNYSGSIR